jgi:hypothetical protein
MGDSGAPLFLTGEPEIKFRLTDIDPPSDVYIARDDLLRITIITRTPGFPVTVLLRILLPGREIIPNQFEVIPQGGQLASTATFNLTEGFLLSATATMLPLFNTRGDGFVIVELVRAGTPVVSVSLVLISGFITGRQALTYPTSPVTSPFDQRGLIRSVLGTNPGAGVEITETVPAGVMWRLSSIAFRLVTDATAGNRQVILRLDDGSSTFADIPAPAVQIALLDVGYTFGDGLTSFASAFDQIAPTPRGVLLQAGWRIRTLTTNLQAGDNFGAPEFNIEEWPNGT